MTPFAHVAAGYLTTQIVDLLYPGLNFNSPGIIVTGIIAGNIPDLDFLVVKNKLHHRDTWTHAPIMWAVVILVLLLIAKYLNNDTFFPYVLAFSLGVTSHFFTDWYAAREKDHGGIRLLYPFSKKHFGMLKLKEPLITEDKDFDLVKYAKYYMENAFLFYSEVVLIILGVVVFLSRSLSVFLGIFR
ncbi:MAG: metal-dependent hydrolase [Patescibacteria group bacterium]